MPSDFTPVGAPVHRRRLGRLETALAARRNVLELIPALSYRQPIVSGEMLSRWHMLTDPAGMKRVLLDNVANYPKSEIMKRMLRPAIGESLFNADGAEWKWQRQAVAPVFTHRNVVALAPAMAAAAQRSCERLAAAGRKPEMVGQMMTATFEVICDVALSGRKHFDSLTFGQAISAYFRTAGRASLLDFLGVPDWLPRPGRLMAVPSVQIMHEMVGASIEARRRQTDAPADDLLARMLEAHDPETGQRMTPDQLIFNMQFFIVAGHETTALALSWALYLLANAPEDQDAVRREVQAVLNGRHAEPAELDALPLVRQVLEEAMRLYPPVGLLARTVTADDELCGRRMRPDDILFLPIWALHRHDLLWEQPGKFRPARFSKDGERPGKYQYLPFGAGPRVCIGADFAMMQATIILSAILQRFRFRPGNPAPKPIMMMTVRPEPGVFLEIETI